MEEPEQFEIKQDLEDVEDVEDVENAEGVDDAEGVEQRFASDIIGSSEEVEEVRYQTADALHYLDHMTIRKSLPIATKYEICRILAERVYQLNLGAPPLITWNGVRSGLSVTEMIAREELRQRKIPLIVRRTFPNGGTEDWKLQDFRRIDC